MTGFYVLKLLDNQGIYRPDTFVLGDVELRSPSSDFTEELTAIKKSIEKNGVQLNYEVNCRIGTIIHTNSLDEANLLADERFVKALDIISSELPVSNVRLTNCGYIKNLANGELRPIEDVSFSPNLSFVVSKGTLQPFEFSQWVATQKSDLAVRYRRSLHWARNGKWEKNLQIKILFEWFAVEALFKESPSENVGPIIRWFLGYPNGHSAALVSPSLILKLKSNPLYDIWKNKISDSIEAIRKFRNYSVHSGFRNVDFSVSEIKLYSQIMVLGCSRCQRAVTTALREGIKTVKEFKEYISLIFENNESLVNDIHGTILFSLQNGTYHYLSRNIYG
jgi:hypothetical protein